MFKKFVPPIERITDEVEFAKVLLKSKDNCSYFTEQFLSVENFDYNIPYLNCEERFVVYRSGRQCFEENEFIYTESGIKQVKEIKNDDKILGGFVDDLNKFEDDVIEVRFWNGVKVKVNLQHPFYTKDGWKETKDLTLKDRVEFSNNTKFNFSNNSIGENKARLFGYLYSDGYFAPKQSVKFVNINQNFHNEVRELTKKEFGIISKMGENNTRQYLVGKHGSTSNVIIDYIKENNLMDHSLGLIMSLKENELKQFLNGYFNGDGYLYVGQKKDRPQKKVELGFSVGISELRAYELQFVLWRLGIDSIVKEEWMKTSTRPFYRVLISKQIALKNILSWIDRQKYPDKFDKADKGILQWNFKHYGNFIEYDDKKQWVKIRSISEKSKGNVIGFSVTPNEEFYSYLGMRSHNCGKSRNAALKALHFGYFAGEKAGNIDEGVANVVIASLSKDQANLIFKKISNFIHKSAFLTENIERETKSEITLRWFNGAGRTEFIVRPIGDTGDSLRGWTTHMAILDEAGYIPEVVYNAFLPSTVTTKPRILLTSTPKGKAGKFFQSCQESYMIYEKGIPRFIKGNEDRDKNPWVQFHVTTYDNPLAASDPAILKLISNTTEAARKQELMGEFIDGGNALIPYNMLQHALTPVKKSPEFLYYDLGVDTSGKGQDETVLITAGITEDNQVYPVDVYTELTTDQTDLANLINKRNNFYKYRNIFIDSTGIGDSLLDCCGKVSGLLPTYGINFKSDKTDIYVNLARLFNDKLINLSLLEDLHKEKCIDQLSYMYWEYGDFKDQTPKARSSTRHDDYPDALALVLCGQREGDFIQNIPNDFLNPQ